MNAGRRKGDRRNVTAENTEKSRRKKEEELIGVAGAGVGWCQPGGAILAYWRRRPPVSFRTGSVRFQPAG